VTNTYHPFHRELRRALRALRNLESSSESIGEEAVHRAASDAVQSLIAANDRERDYRVKLTYPDFDPESDPA
jgi:hypothetical protein